MNPDPGDASLLVRFWMDAYKNEAKSKGGQVVYETVPWVEIKVPGERDTVTGPVHKLSPDPRQRFPAAWAKFQQDESSEGLTGTPLKLWPGIERGDVEMLKWNSVKTVEQLAAVSDNSLSNIPGGIALRQRAKDYLKAAKEQAPVAAMSAELEKRDAEIAALRAQIAEIAEGKKRGRKSAEE